MLLSSFFLVDSTVAFCSMNDFVFHTCSVHTQKKMRRLSHMCRTTLWGRQWSCAIHQNSLERARKTYFKRFSATHVYKYCKVRTTIQEEQKKTDTVLWTLSIKTLAHCNDNLIMHWEKCCWFWSFNVCVMAKSTRIDSVCKSIAATCIVCVCNFGWKLWNEGYDEIYKCSWNCRLH